MAARGLEQVPGILRKTLIRSAVLLACLIHASVHSQDHVIEDLEPAQMRICIGNLSAFEALHAAFGLDTKDLRLVSVQRVQRENYERHTKDAIPAVKAELLKLHASNLADTRAAIKAKAAELNTIHASLRTGQWCPPSGCWDSRNAALINTLLKSKGVTVDQVVGTREATNGAGYHIIYYDAPGEPDGAAAATTTAATTVTASIGGSQQALFKKNIASAKGYLARHWAELVPIARQLLDVELTADDLRRAARALDHATLVPQEQWATLLDKYPGNDNARTAPAFTDPNGQIYLKDQPGNQGLAETMLRIFMDEAIHCALLPHGTTEAQDHEVRDEFFK